MSKSQHTPGPWRATDLDQHPGIENHDESVSIVIFGYRKGLDSNHYDDSGVRGKTRKEAIANAHLIAAAPDLLEALENVLSEIFIWESEHGLHPYAIKARAAIAKAKGGGE